MKIVTCILVSALAISLAQSPAGAAEISKADVAKIAAQPAPPPPAAPPAAPSLDTKITITLGELNAIINEKQVEAASKIQGDLAAAQSREAFAHVNQQLAPVAPAPEVKKDQAPSAPDAKSGKPKT